MNELANGLNQQIKQNNPYVYELLSDLGKKLYYPKGILSQSAEASKMATRFNATIGIATEGSQPMYLPVIQDTLSAYEPKDIYTYAPPAGKPELRNIWKEKMFKENPSLEGKTTSLPIVTNALTHGLSIVADLFIDTGDTVILPDKLWGNYHVIFGIRRNANVQTFPFYNSDYSFNSKALKEVLLTQKDKGKAVLVLNFPNNPTGYTPMEKETDEIVKVLKEVADEGINLVVVSDDAYFGLFYEDSIHESLFGRIANTHPRILAIKVDGPTKEDYVWGFRVGFITYGDSHEEVTKALEEKTMGIIRGTISNSSHPSQTIVLHALKSAKFDQQREDKYTILRNRALKVKEVLQDKKFADFWEYYPFNSGYFMCLRLKQVNAEELRLHLLQKYGVGVISIGQTDIRVAFSCVEEKDLEELFQLIYQGAKDLA